MLYFDTSFIAPLILEEGLSKKIETFAAKLPAGELCISHWTRVEFAILIFREVRMGGLAARDALAAARLLKVHASRGIKPWLQPETDISRPGTFRFKKLCICDKSELAVLIAKYG